MPSQSVLAPAIKAAMAAPATTPGSPQCVCRTARVKTTDAAHGGPHAHSRRPLGSRKDFGGIDTGHQAPHLRQSIGGTDHQDKDDVAAVRIQ